MVSLVMKSRYNVALFATVFVCGLCFQFLPRTHGAPDLLYPIPEQRETQFDSVDHPSAALWYSSLNKSHSLTNSSSMVNYVLKSESTEQESPSGAHLPQGSAQARTSHKKSTQLLDDDQALTALNQSAVHLSPAKEGPSGSPLVDRPSAGDAGKFECVEKIFLWTKGYKRGQEFELISDAVSVKKSHFVSGAKTYVIIHGFMSDGLQPWIIELKEKLLSRETCNVISVQWWAGTTWANYITVVHQGYVECTAKEAVSVLAAAGVVRQLLPGSLHLIGHSLGAHVAGFMGKHLRGIDRITGLDPAGYLYRDSDKAVRLDKTDANYVDVMHTNSCNPKGNPWFSCYGIYNSIGHTDFWPNGGEYQPACRQLRSTASAVSDGLLKGAIGCDHQMSYTYFIESLDYGPYTTKFLARPAHSYQEFNNNNASCGSSIQYMGFFADYQSRGGHFLNTSAIQPYAYMDGECLSRKGLLLQSGSIFSAYAVFGVTFLAIIVPAIVIFVAPALAAGVTIVVAAICGCMTACAFFPLRRLREEDEEPILGNGSRTENEGLGEDQRRTGDGDCSSLGSSTDYGSQLESFDD